MPPQSRAAQCFAGAAVEIDLICKGIMTFQQYFSQMTLPQNVEIDLICKGIMTSDSTHSCQSIGHSSV